MHPVQAKITIAASRIQSVEPQFGAVTIRSERVEHHYPNAWVMPGLVESHAHIYGLGKRLLDLNLFGTRSAEECVERAGKHSESLGNWLTGMGWNQELWPGRAMPDKAMLDAAFPTTPVYLRRADGHAAWVNSAALKLAGIGPDTREPAGGAILKDRSGRPSGILVDSAMNLVARLIPSESPEQIMRYIETATTEFARLGITEVHDMDVNPALLPYYRELAEKGSLPVRVQSYIQGQNDEWLQERLLPAGGEFLRVYAVKLYADGALGSRGACLLAPYEDQKESYGLALLNKEQLNSKVATILEYGWNVAIHAIGDAANRAVLDTYEKMRRDKIADDETILRIEHAQIVHRDDQDRFGRFNIIPAVQAVHCISDAEMAEQRLGERCAWAYPWRSLRNGGAILAGGSDAPIESPDPLIGIDAFCRRIPFDTSDDWYAEECITREEALLAYTQWAHEAADVAYRRGILKPRYDADLVVMDRNLLNCPDNEVQQCKILATYSGGKRRYVAEQQVTPTE